MVSECRTLGSTLQYPGSLNTRAQGLCFDTWKTLSTSRQITCTKFSENLRGSMSELYLTFDSPNKQ
jgi:hypothetical protein